MYLTDPTLYGATLPQRELPITPFVPPFMQRELPITPFMPPFMQRELPITPFIPPYMQQNLPYQNLPWQGFQRFVPPMFQHGIPPYFQQQQQQQQQPFGFTPPFMTPPFNQMAFNPYVPFYGWQRPLWF